MRRPSEQRSQQRAAECAAEISRRRNRHAYSEIMKSSPIRPMAGSVPMSLCMQVFHTLRRPWERASLRLWPADSLYVSAGAVYSQEQHLPNLTSALCDSKVRAKLFQFLFTILTVSSQCSVFKPSVIVVRRRRAERIQYLYATRASNEAALWSTAVLHTTTGRT